MDEGTSFFSGPSCNFWNAFEKTRWQSKLVWGFQDLASVESKSCSADSNQTLKQWTFSTNFPLRNGQIQLIHSWFLKDNGRESMLIGRTSFSFSLAWHLPNLHPCCSTREISRWQTRREELVRGPHGLQHLLTDKQLKEHTMSWMLTSLHHPASLSPTHRRQRCTESKGQTPTQHSFIITWLFRNKRSASVAKSLLRFSHQMENSIFEILPNCCSWWVLISALAQSGDTAQLMCQSCSKPRKYHLVTALSAI